MKARENGRVVSKAVIMAVGVNTDGRREVLGMDIGPSEAETFWTAFLRKLVRRVRGIARMQFTGGTRIIETMQEALQGMRMVKAFGLEDEMRRRLGTSEIRDSREFRTEPRARRPDWRW